MSLKVKTASGMFWSLLQGVGGRFIQFLVTIVLARLLTPDDFGLIAMITIFVQISQSLINAGFRQGLIRKKNVDEADYATVFYINLVVSVSFYLIIFFCAPLVANFYKQPILVPLVRVLLLIFIFNGFSYIQETKLIKEMNFKRLMIIQIPSTIIGGLISIVFAYLGYGVWSIVAMQLGTRVAYSIQIWLYSKWRPLFVFDKKKAENLFSYGSRLMVSGLINTVYQNIYLVTIGKFFSLSSLGYYQTANNIVQYPSGTITTALNVVSFSSFASIKDNDELLKEGYRKMIQQILYWMCPVFIFSAILAQPIITFLFTSKWLPSVPYFQALCVVGVLYPLNVYNKNIINVKGRSDIYLKLTIIEKIFTTIVIIVAIPFGIWALIAVQIATSIFAYLINSYYSDGFINYSTKEQFFDILPTILASAFSGVAVYLIDLMLEGSFSFVRLVVGFSVGFAFYWIGTIVLKISAYNDFVQIFKEKFLKKTNISGKFGKQ